MSYRKNILIDLYALGKCTTLVGMLLFLAGCFGAAVGPTSSGNPVEKTPAEVSPPEFIEEQPREVFSQDNLILIDEVFTTEPAGGMHELVESAGGASQIKMGLNMPMRTLPNNGGPKYFAYKLGKGKGLVAGKPYVLEVEYPEDTPRTVWVINRGGRINRGFHTGTTVGDALRGKYVHGNLESLNLPLSQKMETFREFFHLLSATPGINLARDNDPNPNQPEDGFWVLIAQADSSDQPMSEGAAAYRIAVYEVIDQEKEYLQINYPPENLPRRSVFYRGEMYDQSLEGNNPSATDDQYFSYHAKRMKVLGINTFGKDLLEFGHNQGWVADPSGSSNWYNQPSYTDRWKMIIDTAKEHDLSVIPYFEYSGAIGQDINQALGLQKRSQPLRGANADYTNVPWVEGANVDITDPAFIEEAKRILNKTIVAYKDDVHFIGAWFRTRPAAWPVSFADAARARFAMEANGGQQVSRNQLMDDPGLKEYYTNWWFDKRKVFLRALADHLKQYVHDDMAVFLTTDYKEGAYGLGHSPFVATDQAATWESKNLPLSIIDINVALQSNTYLNTVKDWIPTWGDYEWQHAAPPADPENYTEENGAMIAYPMNRNFSANSKSAFDAYRTQKGLAVVKNYYLNENEMENVGGYFVGDMDAAGPYAMMTEVLAMANGDPRYLGYLSSHDYNRGFPEVVRAFNAAFLALPALPSVIVDGITDTPNVVVRKLSTPSQGTYYAIMHIGMTTASDVSLTFPHSSGTWTNAATGKKITMEQGKITMTLAPFTLIALHVLD